MVVKIYCRTRWASNAIYRILQSWGILKKLLRVKGEGAEELCQKPNMDIRSIIDSEDTPPPRRPSASTPVKQDYRPIPPRPPNPYEAQQLIYDNRREARPPQPSPLQTHGKGDLQYPNGPVPTTIENTSPWRHTSSVGSNSGPYAPPQSVNQSPIRGHPPPQYTQRENHSASAAASTRSFGHSTPLSQTPTSSTPGSAGAYSNFPRPTSSHSIPTPSSAQYPPNVLRESPQPSQMRIISQSQPSQQYMSQPGTPLGPPSTFRRASFNPVRESPGTHDRQRNLSGGSFSQPQSATPSPATARSPQIYREQRSQSSLHGYSGSREREKSLSVSPKTRLPNLPNMDRREPLEAMPNQAPPWAGHAAPAKRKAEREPSDVVLIEPPRLNRTPSRVTSLGVNGLLNTGPSDEAQHRVAYQQQIERPLTKAPDYKSSASTQFQVNERPPAYQSQSSFNQLSGLLPSTPSAASVQTPGTIRPATPPTSDRNSKLLSQSTSNREPSMPAMIEPPTAHHELNESPSQSVKKVASWKMAANAQATQSIKTEGIGAPNNGVEISSEPVKKKIRLGDSPKESVLPSIEKPSVRTAAVPTTSQSTKTKPPRISRWQDVPVYAQSVRGPKRTAELFALSLQRRGTEQRVLPPNQVLNKTPVSQTPGQVNGVPNAKNPTPPINGVRMPVAQPALANNGPLGPWEPSILNIIPSEELTRVISDWLFEHVVLREDVGVGPAGGAADQGAVLEIEAKIGQLMDKNTNDRIRIPVLNECVVSHTDPNLKIAFKSSMTEVRLSPSTTPFLLSANLCASPRPSIAL